MDCEATSVHNLLERMIVDESIEPTGLPLALLRAITNNFSANQQIGKGGFAVVYKVQQIRLSQFPSVLITTDRCKISCSCMFTRQCIVTAGTASGWHSRCEKTVPRT
jgi:hypothetical protein